ncbi:hypothetical protein BGZ93_001240 [Podila epicladia]|nr:hypothetical protein BGZ93_001240 [Podila epicladia]
MAGEDSLYNRLENYEALSQPLDGIVTKEYGCIVFPNIYQHQVQPSELQDPSKPSTRKILVFFLVNPKSTVFSTTHVPRPQKEWVPRTDLQEKVVRKLPQELMDQVDKLVEWPIELGETLAHRLELMKERKFFVGETNQHMFERPLYLCER